MSNPDINDFILGLGFVTAVRPVPAPSPAWCNGGGGIMDDIMVCGWLRLMLMLLGYYDM